MNSSEAELNHLIHMANQIADNNTAYREPDQAVELVATHLKKFWARSMKQSIIDYAEKDGEQLNAIARLAVKKLAVDYQKA